MVVYFIYGKGNEGGGGVSTEKTVAINIQFFLLFLFKFGADNLTFPGTFLVKSPSLTAFIRVFSYAAVSFIELNICSAVFTTFPRFPVPGISLTLNL